MDVDATEPAAQSDEAPATDGLPPATGAAGADVEESAGLVTPAAEGDVRESREVTDRDAELAREADQDVDDSAVERVPPGSLPSLEDTVSWEIAAMTTPDYTAPHSIHDREHDSWPVEAEDGDAVPAWSDDVPEEHAAAPMGDALEEIGELLLDEEAAGDPWDVDTPPRDADESHSDFPLDAFIVPAGVPHAPSGYDADVARRVALRLDEIARQLRGGGLGSLGRTDSTDELSRVLAAIVTGYVARDD